LKPCPHGRRQINVPFGFTDRRDRFAERHTRSEVERNLGGREGTEMTKEERHLLYLDTGDGFERNLSRLGDRRRKAQGEQRLDRRRACRVRTEDDAMLGRLREHRGDDSLPEGIEQHVVDRRERNAESRSRVPIDREDGREPPGLLLATYVRELGRTHQPLDQSFDPGLQSVGVRAHEKEPVPRAPLAGIDGEILDRLEKERDVGVGSGHGREPPHDVAHGGFAFVLGLQGDE